MIVALVLAVVLCLVVVLHRHMSQRESNALPSNWPVIGMLPAMFYNRERIHNFCVEVLRKSGGTFEFKGPQWFGHLDFVITCDPSNIEHILNTNFTNYPKGDEFRDMFDVLGDGILSADGDLWKLHRKMFQTWNVRQKKFEFVSKTIQQKVVDDLIPFLDHVSQEGIQVNLQEILDKMLTFDNSISLIFGYDIASSANFKHPKSEYQKAFEEIQQTLFRRHVTPESVWKFQRWLGIGGEQKYKKAMKVFRGFMHECIVLKRKEKSEYNLDYMAIYMEENKKPFADKFLIDVALNMAAASRDTITATLTWFFWLTATHPIVEAKILDEMKENLKTGDGYLRAEILNKLVYLQAALCETLRLYPALPFNHKSAAERDILPSGHNVSAKKKILISFYATGRMEELWGKDCLDFKPERWITLDSNGLKKLMYVSPHKFPAFNEGPRSCVGKDIAFIQAKVVAINVLRAYRLHVVEGHPTVPSLTISLYMKHGLKMIVSKRFD